MHRTHYKKLSWQERLEIANDLNSVAYGFVGQEIPRLDKTKFAARGSI